MFQDSGGVKRYDLTGRDQQPHTSQTTTTTLSMASLILPSSPTTPIYQVHPGPEITDEILQQCSELFSNNYGIWGKTPNGKGPQAWFAASHSFLDN
jgi:hypothetical protein